MKPNVVIRFIDKIKAYSTVCHHFFEKEKSGDITEKFSSPDET